MIGSELRSEFASIPDVLAKNIDFIKDLYVECLASSLDEIQPEESHLVFCTITAICLLNDYDKIVFPLSYNPEDEKLIAEVTSYVDVLMNIEAMADKGIINRKVIDGEQYYGS